MYKFIGKSNNRIRKFEDFQYKPMAVILDKSFCWWHINDQTNEIDRSSEPWDDETCWWVVDSMYNKCNALYGMDSRYPISICPECKNIQEE